MISIWRLDELVTGGRWYQVFRAAPKSLTDPNSHDYILKLVNPELPSDQASLALERLGREAIATDMIQHPGIIPLLDAEQDRPPFFLVQPWIAGGSLDKFYASANDISLTRTLWIVRQVVEAISAAHDAGRVYLGLQPAHVLLGTGGRVTLIGWSNSHAIDEKVRLPDSDMTQARYRAPETFDSECRASAANDIYSIGAFIYNAISGSTPFNASDWQNLARLHCTKAPVSLQNNQPLCPPRLSRLVDDMLSKFPVQRPRIREILDELISIELEYLEHPALIRL